MSAAVLAQAAFEMREIDVPTFGAGEVLVRTVACGVCTGDLYLYENRAELGSAHRRLGH